LGRSWDFVLGRKPLEGVFMHESHEHVISSSWLLTWGHVSSVAHDDEAEPVSVLLIVHAARLACHTQLLGGAELHQWTVVVLCAQRWALGHGLRVVPHGLDAGLGGWGTEQRVHVGTVDHQLDLVVEEQVGLKVRRVCTDVA